MKKKISKAKNYFKFIGEDESITWFGRGFIYLFFLGIAFYCASCIGEYIIEYWKLGYIENKYYIYGAIFTLIFSIGITIIRTHDRKLEFKNAHKLEKRAIKQEERAIKQEKWTRLSNAASLLLTEGATPQAKRAGLVELIQLKHEGFEISYINRITSSGLDLQNVNLSETDLKRVDLRRADLSGGKTELWKTNLEEANLSGAILEKASLRGAILEKAELKEAKLKEAKLNTANLRDANLWGANLEKAILLLTDLKGANLTSVNLKGAYLHLAKLESADLRGTDLSSVDLSLATYNEDTKFPKGFNPKDHNMIKED